MEYRRNRLFFMYRRTKLWTGVGVLSYVFFALAVLALLWFLWLPPALPFAIVGTVLFFISRSMLTDEKHMTEQAARIRKRAEEKFAALPKQGGNASEPFVFESWDFQAAALFCCRGKKRLYASCYRVTQVLWEAETLCVLTLSADLLEEKEEVSCQRFFFSELSGSEVGRETVCREGIDGILYEFDLPVIRLYDKEGKEATVLYHRVADYTMDNFCETLAHRLETLNRRASASEK